MSASRCSSARAQAGPVNRRVRATMLSDLLSDCVVSGCPTSPVLSGGAEPHRCAGVMHSTRCLLCGTCGVLLGPNPNQKLGNDPQDKIRPARMASKLSQPTNSSALSTLCAGCATLHVVIAEYLWPSHSAPKIVSDNAYEEPHDTAALSLHGAAPAPARVKLE